MNQSHQKINYDWSQACQTLLNKFISMEKDAYRLGQFSMPESPARYGSNRPSCLSEIPGE